MIYHNKHRIFPTLGLLFGAVVWGLIWYPYRVLEQAGLIEREVRAQRRICRLRGPAFREAFGWLEGYRHFWEESLDRLAEFLESQAASSKTSSVSRTRRKP